MVSGFVKDLECLIERIPKELPVWRQLGRGDPQCAIAESNHEPGRLLFGKSSKQANERREALSWIVHWLTRYGHSSQARAARESSLNDLSGIEEAWSAAKVHKKVKDLLSEVRCAGGTGPRSQMWSAGCFNVESPRAPIAKVQVSGGRQYPTPNRGFAPVQKRFSFLWLPLLMLIPV